MSCSLVILETIWANVFLAMLLSLLIAALIYMVGNLIRKQEYIEFSKSEMYNFLVTGALVISFLGIVAIVNEISCPNSSASLFDQAVSGMSTILYDSVYRTLRNLFQMMLTVSTLSNMVVEFSGVKFNPFGGLRYLYTSLNVVSFIMESVFASLYIQLIALVVFKEIALSIIFPVGIFLRAFSLTRDAGSFLMALSLSLYTVYPYIYVVSLDAYKTVQQDITYDKLTSGFYHSGGFAYSAYNVFSKIENTAFWGLTFFNYYGMRAMFLDLGGQLVLSLVIPAIAILLSTALVSSLMKFIKEVTA